MTTEILRSGVRALTPFIVVVAVLLVWRGHDAPGGGFIGALVGGVALTLVELTSRPQDSVRWLPAAPVLLGLGLAISVVSGLVPLVFGGAFLQGTYVYVPVPLVGEVGVASSIVFDIGVALVVLGVVRGLLEALMEEPT